MSELNLLVVLRAKAGREAELRHNLSALVAPSRAEDGNLRYELYADAQDPGRFVFVESWQTADAQQRHHNESTHIRHFHHYGDADVERRELVLALDRIA